jgi:AraC family transcriptional regulator, regulatory protein of adaptative response / methylated-DNA-[protein]-cysteine methyltransferase
MNQTPNEIIENSFNPSFTNKLTTKIINTPVGEMFAVASEDGICMFEFIYRKLFLSGIEIISNELKANIIFGESALIEELEKQINEYFQGKLKKFDLKLNIIGTDFQKKVWNELIQIPYGETRSYKQQSLNLNNPLAIRAVASANGKNRIAIIIPCHRVIGENGNLTGYGGGIANKRFLLELERKFSDMKELF